VGASRKGPGKRRWRNRICGEGFSGDGVATALEVEEKAGVSLDQNGKPR